MEGTRHRLLQSLNGHEFRTGDEIGSPLGLTRAAIHKQIQALVSQGVPIHRVPGRGYRLADGVTLLDESALANRLSERASALLNGIEVLEEVDSTSAHMERTKEVGPLHGRVCLAEKQTAGRGRRGRAWIASPYRDLMMSIGVEYPQWPAQLPTLGLVTALTLIKALKRLGATGLTLKWPNDVVCDLRKVCGVLLDVAGEAHGVCRIIVGIGINVSMSPEAGRAIEQQWVDLETIMGRTPDRNLVAAECLNALLPCFQTFDSDGFAKYRCAWRSLDALRGRAVTVHGADGVSREGVAAGVDAAGRLKVTHDDGETRRFTQGDVTVRPR